MTKFVFLILFCLSANFIHSAVSKKESQELDVLTELKKRLDVLRTNPKEASEVGFTGPLPSYCEPVALELYTRADSYKKGLLSAMRADETIVDAQKVGRQVEFAIQSMFKVHTLFDQVWIQKVKAELGVHRRVDYDRLMHDYIKICPKEILGVEIFNNGQIKINFNKQVFGEFVGRTMQDTVEAYKEQLDANVQREAEIETHQNSATSFKPVEIDHIKTACAPKSSCCKACGCSFAAILRQTLLQGLSSEQIAIPYISFILDWFAQETARLAADKNLRQDNISCAGSKLLEEINRVDEIVNTVWTEHFLMKMHHRNRSVYNDLVDKYLRNYSGDIFNIRLSQNHPSHHCDFLNINNYNGLLSSKIQEQVSAYLVEQDQKEKKQQKALEVENRRKAAAVLRAQQALLDEEKVKQAKARRKKSEAQKTQVEAAVVAALVTNSPTAEEPQIVEELTVTDVETDAEMQRRRQQSKDQREKNARCRQEKVEAALQKAAAAARKKAARAELERQQSVVEELTSQLQGQQSSAEQELPVQKPGCAPANIHHLAREKRITGLRAYVAQGLGLPLSEGVQ